MNPRVAALPLILGFLTLRITRSWKLAIFVTGVMYIGMTIAFS